MSNELEVDYLVVGAGAAGRAFTDELLASRRRASASSAVELPP